MPPRQAPRHHDWVTSRLSAGQFAIFVVPMADCLDLDRLAPTRRPDAPRSGHQSWRDLLFAHHVLDAGTVRAVVPPELELDLWDGRAWVGLVPFTMQDIRLAWMPRRAGLDFLETNVRTYVHHRGEPGVYFFSLEASSRLAVKAARWGWGLPYHHASMTTSSDGEIVRYDSVRRSDPRAALSVTYRAGQQLGASGPGSLEFFLLERYLLFSVRGGRVLKGHVHHEAYPAQRASITSISDGLIEAAGLPRARGLPDVAHFSKGVDVEVFGPWPLAK